MSDEPVQLDEHRGMAAQKATEGRRRRSAARDDRSALQRRAAEIEADWAASPAASWGEAAEKARYLLGLLATTSVAQDARRQRLIARVLADFRTLGAASGEPPGTD